MAMVMMRVVGEMGKTADAVAVGVFENGGMAEGVKKIDKVVGGVVGRVLGMKDFKGKAGTVMVVPGEGGFKRVILVGLGKRDGFDVDQLRWAAGSVAKAASGGKMKRVVMCLHGDLPHDAGAEKCGQAMAEGAVIGSWAYREFKKENGEEGVEFLAVEERGTVRGKVAAGVKAGMVIGSAVNYAREIASKPGNVIHPGTLVAEAKRLAGREKLKMSVIDAKKARAMGMGGLTAVGQGSLHPPAMIFLEYVGPGASGKKATVVVGKAITFDTGGLSIKPTASMLPMKYDKCGGMAVLGIMQAAARLKLPVKLVGVIPTAENSVSAAAYRPADILRMYNGKTVEVTNTDAEGRLVLADALAYAAEKYKPAAMIDMATLTGGVVVALGSVYAGMFCNDDALAREMEEAGKTSGEWLWRLPLHERYQGLMEGYHSDLVNSGSREASPVQGAIFLEHFVPGGVKWAHLDIAGTGDLDRGERYLVKGATGFGVRVVVEWLRGQS